MRFRLLVVVLATFTFSLLAGCSGGGGDKPPKADLPPGAKTLQKKTPGGAGPQPQ